MVEFSPATREARVRFPVSAYIFLFFFVAHTETGKMKDDFGHLLDFLQNLKKLKVSRYTCVIFDNSDN